MIPKARLDALTDGIFAISMTLLVLSLELPNSFVPRDDADLVDALSNLDGEFLAYVISFFVLGVRWLGHVRIREEPERANSQYGLWTIVHLFFVSCMPFSTMLVGQYAEHAPAVWIYAANMIASALAAIRLSFLAERETGRRPARTGRLDLTVLILSALLSAAIGLVNPGSAMWAYLLNAAAPLIRR